MTQSGLNLNSDALQKLPDIAHSVDVVEATHGVPVAQPEVRASPPTPPASAGRLLRQAREAQGLHVAALAVSLKVPVRKLEALEADQVTDGQDAVFVRALAGSVCRTLKIDPAPVLALMPQSGAVNLGKNPSGLNAPLAANMGGQREGASEQLSKPIVLGVLLLLVATLIFYFWPNIATTLPQTSGVSQAASTAIAAVVPVAVAPPVAGGETVIGAPREAPVPSIEKSTATSALAAGTPTGVVAAVVSAATSAVGAETLQIKATKEVWVDVMDASGKILLRKTMAAGDVAGASATAGSGPLKVTIGRADSAEILVRGNAFDLTPHVRGTIARFEVR